MLAGPAVAEPWGLTAKPLECAALESLVMFGMVDEGPGNDTREMSGVVGSGDRARCMAWLDSFGLGDGMRLESCRAAFERLSAEGLPNRRNGTEPDVIRDVLSPQYDMACDDMLSGRD
jgi:hypothetical protein